MTLRGYLLKSALIVGDYLQRLYLGNGKTSEVTFHLKDLRYGSHSQQQLDVLKPDGRGTFPIIVYMHGGAWLSGDKSAHTALCGSFASQGFLVFNVNYRLAPRYTFPTQIQDVAQGLAWIYENAARYGGDISRIILAGDSAGAHLALWYTTALQHLDVFAQVGIDKWIPTEAVIGNLLYYGLFDLESVPPGLVRWLVSPFLECDWYDRDLRVRLASPVNMLSAGLPPILLVCGERDMIYDQSLRLASALEEVGACYEALLLDAVQYPGAWHAFMKYPNRKCTKTALEASLKFLQGRAQGR